MPYSREVRALLAPAPAPHWPCQWCIRRLSSSSCVWPGRWWYTCWGRTCTPGTAWNPCCTRLMTAGWWPMNRPILPTNHHTATWIDRQPY